VTDSQRDDIVALCAESHSYADLDSLPLDCLRHDAVETDCDKQQREHAEEAG
jgi:hypothetical protein